MFLRNGVRWNMNADIIMTLYAIIMIMITMEHEYGCYYVTSYNNNDNEARIKIIAIARATC